MLLPTITNDTQMTRSNDFNHATVGEIAQFGSTCSRATPDDNCGCARSMVGVDSRKASTTVKITDVEMTETELLEKLSNGYVKHWGMDEKTATKFARTDMKQLLSIGQSFPLNSVLEIRGSQIKTRSVVA